MATHKIYIASDPVNAEIVKDYLGAHGIFAEVRGHYLWGGMGELPANAYPTLWVADSADVAPARQLIERFEAGSTATRGAWHCPQCAEQLPGQFEACWRCGARRAEY